MPAERLGSPLHLGLGKVLRGFARVDSGEGEEGIGAMQQAMDELAGIGTGLGAPQALCLLAEALRKVGLYAWFTESFATRDLKEAKALLEEIAG